MSCKNSLTSLLANKANKRLSNILVSRCLLGEAVRFDGQSKPLFHSLLSLWQQQGRLVAVCPEVLGGLSIPRPPAEIYALRVLTQDGKDVSEAFEQGAYAALRLAQKHHCKHALLKANSPSCGNTHIYDGHFRGHLIQGQGVCAQLLAMHGIAVFNETQIEALAQSLQDSSRF